MKLKYMLRGLGIGVLVSAAIMGAYTRNAVADARVAVMKQYGFGEEPTLVGDEEETKTSESETETEETIPIIVRDEAIESEVESVIESAKAAETQSESVSESVEESSDVTEGSLTNESKSEMESSSASEVVELPATIDIIVSSGDDSGKVSRKLYNAGIVDSASEYDAFLMQHGYDKKISVGTKTINITDTWQEIAEKLTSK
jgi:hypothetical protein